MRYFLPKKTEISKHEKSKKLNFFVPFVCILKNFLWDNSLMLCCSPKNFWWFFEMFLVLKILTKKNFCRKKGWTTEISKKNKNKKNEKWPIFADRPEYGSNISGVHLWVLGGASVSILHDLSFKCVLCTSKVRFHYFVLAQ